MRVETPTGSGSGFFVNKRGHILTNEHVVKNLASVKVLFSDGMRRFAEVVATDAARDIALLKVSVGSLSKLPTVLPFASSVEQGEQVIALGHPLGSRLGQQMTMTVGVVSAFRTYGGLRYVQTDAAINPGSSGGPLLNMKGQVVGMNTSSIDATNQGRPVEGIGFAITYDILESRLPIMKAQKPSTTPTPIPTPAPTPTPRQTGPIHGSIPHDPHDGYIDVYKPNVWMTNGSIEARFTNPEPGPKGWSYGFMFRNSQQNHFHAVIIMEYGRWVYVRSLGDTATRKHVYKTSTAIRTQRGQENHIRVELNGDLGTVYINDKRMGLIDLSHLMEPSRPHVIGTYFTGHPKEGSPRTSRT